MTKDDIIRWAHEADREWDCDRDMFEWLEWFANLVAAAERERFAAECIDLVAMYGGPVDLEAAIRARGQECS